MRIGIDNALCEIIDNEGKTLGEPIGATTRNVQSNDPKVKDWQTITGQCTTNSVATPTPSSPEVQCVATFDLTSLKNHARSRLVIPTATAWVRARFTFTLWKVCNGEVTDLGRKVTVVVDGREDDKANGRLGRFDREASDLDGDGLTGGDEKDKDAKGFNDKYRKDLVWDPPKK